VVVWPIGAAHSDSAADSLRARATRRLLARDPEDVAGIQRDPAPRRVLHTLAGVAGRAHGAPRWFADGERLLVTRFDPLADGRLRPDLFVWTPAHDRLERVTSGAGVQMGDPSPDGSSAVALRCAGGSCDVVEVTIATGAVRPVVPADPSVNWYRPRWLPDGRHIVASRHQAGRWRIAEISVADGSVRMLSPDDGAERYDVAVADSGRSLVYVSELGGVPNLVRFDRATAVEQPMTRVTGAALAPEPSSEDGSIYFLHLTSRGLDLHRITNDVAMRAATVVALQAPSALLARSTADAVRASVAARGPFVRDSFAVEALQADRGYGIGPHRPVLMPTTGVSVDGVSYGGALRGADPAGRLSWVLQGRLSELRHWRGGALSAVWRGWALPVTGELVGVGQDLGIALPKRDVAVPVALAGETQWHAAALSTSLSRRSAAGAGLLGGSLFGAIDRVVTLRVGVATGAFRFDPSGTGGADSASLGQAVDGDRGFGYVDAAYTLRGGSTRSVSVYGHASAGRTGGQPWSRQMVGVESVLGLGPLRLRVDGQVGVTAADAPAFEQFALGGTANPLVSDALLPQRITMPGLAQATALGPRMRLVRAAVPLGPFEAYSVAYDVGANTGGRLSQLVGVESRTLTTMVPHGRIPALEVTTGVARHLSSISTDRTTFYTTIRLRP
jgi:hypothetical protein